MTEIPQEVLDAWANCSTPDCQYKVCTWASDHQCAQCFKAVNGEAELIKRFNDTHDITWDESR